MGKGGALWRRRRKGRRRREGVRGLVEVRRGGGTGQELE